MEGSSSNQGMGQRSRPSSLPNTSLTGSQPRESLRQAKTWKQAAGRKAGRCFPRAICRGERELSRSIKRVTLPIDPEDHALPFEEIEDGIQQRLFARSGEDERIGGHGNGIALGSPILAGFHDHPDLPNPGDRPLAAGQTLQAAPELGEGKTPLEAPLAVRLDLDAGR